MRRINNKKAAFEMTMGTIVIIVLAVSMLILGLVLTKKIMCSGIGLTDEINAKVNKEIQTLFEDTGNPVVCLGSSTGDPVSLVPGRMNMIYCAINSERSTDVYRISLISDSATVTDAALFNEWNGGTGNNYWEGTVSTTDKSPKKILRLTIPKTVDIRPMHVKLEVFIGSVSQGTQDLDFSIKSMSGLTSTMC